MKTVKVWDLAVRLFHWALAALVVVAFLTAEDEPIEWHARAGIVVAGLLVFRVIWGFVGPAQVRFATFVRGPATVLAYVRDYVRGRPPRHLSHNPLGALMVVALLAVLLGAVTTGALTFASAAWDGPLAPWIGEGAGEALGEVHEALAHALLFLVPLHVAGVIVSSFLERQNLVGGMITGRKLAVEDEAPAAPRRDRLVAALAVAIACAWGAAQLLLPRAAGAAEPARDAAAPARQRTGAARYAEACGACHLAFPPGLLPAGSWRKLMAGLGEHFGEDASLPAEDRARIEAWLVSSAAESGSHDKSRSILRSLGGETPLRITEVPYWRTKHEDLEPEVFERPSIESRANCAACHPNAKNGSFKRHRVPRS